MQCSKYEKCAFGTYLVPHSLIFIIKTDNQRLSDATLDNMKLFYLKSNSKFYINDFYRSTNEGEYKFYDLGLQGTRDIGLKSGDEEIKEYYLEYNNGDLDTLFVDYKKLNQEDACNHVCKCNYPLELVKFNGKVAIRDSSIKIQKVFIFNKI
jgi:hypothetical protein